MIRITIPGEPKAKGRPRAVAFGGHARLYTPAKTRAWESIIRAEAMDQLSRPIPAGVPVRLGVVFWFALPTSKHRKRTSVPAQPHTSRPDLDNLVKLVKDCLKGLAWNDDSQVAAYGPVEKWRCPQDDNRPRTEISIEELT